MPRSPQLRFQGSAWRPRIEYGGGKELGKRRRARPFHRKCPMHITMRSRRARGAWTLDLFRHKGRVERLVRARAKECRVRIHSFANASNHLHLVVQTPSHDDLKRFLRIVCGMIPRLVTGARKGKSLGEKFWDGLVYSKLVANWRCYLSVRDYVQMNEMEAAGVWAREWGKRARKSRSQAPPE